MSLETSGIVTGKQMEDIKEKEQKPKHRDKIEVKNL